ncbi:MAG TPA: ankyrin repeat domain-containing protein [Bryobacteraceae bacterium]|nr:ankyrin repeat domain-containing protein [Bryobacteraceae bacterium]
MRLTRSISFAAASLAALILLPPAGFSAVSGSPVADAAMTDDLPTVRALVAKKADVNAAQADGATAIHWAAYKDDQEMADLLIRAGANVKAANHDGATALYLASIRGSAPMIEKLLKAGADANEVEAEGETPLMLTSRNGNPLAIKVLLDHGAAINAVDKLRGTTALMWAAEQGHPEAVKTLIDHGANVSMTTSLDTKGNRAYLAPNIQQRKAQGIDFGKSRLQREKEAAAAREKAAGATAEGKDAKDAQAAADEEAAFAAFGRQSDKNGGGLTALVYAARENCIECAQLLVQAHADVNQTTHYGWTPLLTATQNRHYQLSAYLLEHGANPNIPNDGGWTPLYIAVDNRNIEGGDYPVRQPDMDHLEYIKLLLEKGANVNARICGKASTPAECKGDSTETRTIFTMQWLYEDGATPFLRAAQSGDVQLMKLLLAHGADPKINTSEGVTPLAVAAGIGWVEGVTYEWSPEENLEAVKMCLDLGINPNATDDMGRTSLHGAAHKGRVKVIQMLVDAGANLDAHDKGSRDTISGAMQGHTWIPIDYSRGLVRVGVQSALPHPDAEALLAKLMKEKGLEVPPNFGSSICLTTLCKGTEADAQQKQ